MSSIEAVVSFQHLGERDEHWRKELTREEIVRGWTEMPCPECDHFDGTGIFVQPDGSEHECVHCKGTGSVMVTI